MKPRFSLYVDLAGGEWTACMSNNWDDIIKESNKWLDRRMEVYDYEFKLIYNFKNNTWHSY